MNGYKMEVKINNYTRYNTEDLRGYIGDMFSSKALTTMTFDVDYFPPSKAKKCLSLDLSAVKVQKRRGDSYWYNIRLLRPEKADALLPPVERLALAQMNPRRMSRQYMNLLGDELTARVFYIGGVTDSFEMIRVENKCEMRREKKSKEEREAEIRKTLTNGSAVYSMMHDIALLQKIAGRYQKQHRIYEKQQARARKMGIDSQNYASVGTILDRIKMSLGGK